MRHLFIINPAAKKTHNLANTINGNIHSFFSQYPDVKYDTYVSQWCRDAVPYIRRFIVEEQARGNSGVRVHAIGGTGTLFEVINSVIGFKDVEVAAHPYGRANSFLQYFGLDKMNLFFSMKNQVFDRSIPIDLIRCGNNYGVCYGMSGLEAYGNAVGDKWIEVGVPADISYSTAAVLKILTDKKNAQNYSIDIDGVKIEGNYSSVMVANAPCYGVRMYPAVDAHPDDGKLDVYLVKNAPKNKLLRIIWPYTHGKYRKLTDFVSHYSAKTVRMSSDETMCMSIDGEHFYGTSIDYEIMPGALQFVCPEEIDLKMLPRIYNRPKEGLRGER